MADSKHQRWQFTAYETNYDVIDAAVEAKCFKEIGWQDEVCPTTQRKHRQGYFVTQTPLRQSAVRKIVPSVHVEPAKNFTALKNYCKKEETRDPSGNQVTMAFEATHVTIDKFLDLLADAWVMDLSEDRLFDFPEVDVFDEPGRSVFAATADYWRVVKHVLRARPELASIAMAPGPRNLWLGTRSVWLRRAAARREASSISITDEAPESNVDVIEHVESPAIVWGETVSLEIKSPARV